MAVSGPGFGACGLRLQGFSDPGLAVKGALIRKQGF